MSCRAIIAIFSERDCDDTMTNSRATPPNKDVRVSAGCSAGQHVKSFMFEFIDRNEAPSQLSVCVCQGIRLTSRPAPSGLGWKWERSHGPTPTHHHQFLTSTSTAVRSYTCCCSSCLETKPRQSFCWCVKPAFADCRRDASQICLGLFSWWHHTCSKVNKNRTCQPVWFSDLLGHSVCCVLTCEEFID